MTVEEFALMVQRSDKAICSRQCRLRKKRMDDLEQMQRWVAVWKQAGPELEAIRQRDIQQADNVTVLERLTSSIHYAVSLPPRQSSGLVEMQRLLAKLRRTRNERNDIATPPCN